MKNLHLLFHKTYYEKLGTPEFATSLQRKNRELFEELFCADDYRPSAIPGTTTFCMVTSYPGMLIGTGYAHGTGIDGADNDINCGFSFDYATGQPYIPGSSVKGVLSSCFDHPEIIGQFCPDAQGIVSELKKSVFGTEAREDCGVDVFLDAVIRCGDKNGHLLGSDYITPHKSITKNPVPILITKILPEVVVEFRFLLQDSVIRETTVTAEKKKELFLSLLELFGIGAKTNVGYGVLTRMTPEEVANRAKDMPRTQPAAAPARPAQPRPATASLKPAATLKPAVPITSSPEIAVGDVREGTVKNIINIGAFVRLQGTGKDGMIHISKLKPGQRIARVEDIVQRGDRVQVKVLGFNEKGQIQLELIQVL